MCYKISTGTRCIDNIHQFQMYRFRHKNAGLWQCYGQVNGPWKRLSLVAAYPLKFTSMLHCLYSHNPTCLYNAGSYVGKLKHKCMPCFLLSVIFLLAELTITAVVSCESLHLILFSRHPLQNPSFWLVEGLISHFHLVCCSYQVRQQQKNLSVEIQLLSTFICVCVSLNWPRSKDSYTSSQGAKTSLQKPTCFVLLVIWQTCMSVGKNTFSVPPAPSPHVSLWLCHLCLSLITKSINVGLTNCISQN